MPATLAPFLTPLLTLHSTRAYCGKGETGAQCYIHNHRERSGQPGRPPKVKEARMRRIALILAVVTVGVLVASGVALAVSKVGTDRADTLRGTNQDDNLVGLGGNDRLLGLGGSDNLVGGEGRDVVLGGNERTSRGGGDKNLDGGPDNDFVGGGDGADNIVGGDGDDFLVESGKFRENFTDKIVAGDGNDLIVAINEPAYRDVVVCGDGFDRVAADRRDDVARDCERVAVGREEAERLFNSLPRRYEQGLTFP